jgi:hypothetical protein
MKVYIGKYRTFFSIYKLIDKLQKVGVKEDTCDKIGDWFDRCLPFIQKGLVRLDIWRNRKSTQNSFVKIDYYDTWNVDGTIASIVAPLLKTFINEKDESYPGQFENYEQWEEVMKKMLWSFEQLNADWESQFYEVTKSKISFNVIRDDKPGSGYQIFNRMNFDGDITRWAPRASEEHRKRIQDGLDLFAKHYFSLWN